MSYASAFFAAQRLGMGNTTFHMLADGDRFRFAASPPGEVLVKSGRFYRAPDGRRYTTGSYTAVFKLPAEETK